MTDQSHRRFAAALLAAFACIWIALAWDPWFREAWVLENVLTVVLLPWLVVSHGRLPLSKLSYSLLFIFLCLHTVGSHYTYSAVPYDQWWRQLGFQFLQGWIWWRSYSFKCWRYADQRWCNNGQRR